MLDLGSGPLSIARRQMLHLMQEEQYQADMFRQWSALEAAELTAASTFASAVADAAAVDAIQVGRAFVASYFNASRVVGVSDQTFAEGWSHWTGSVACGWVG